MENKKTIHDFQDLYGHLAKKKREVLQLFFKYGSLTAQEVRVLLKSTRQETAVRVMILRLVRDNCLELNSFRKDKITGHSATTWQLTWQRPKPMEKQNLSEQLKKYKLENDELKQCIALLNKKLEALSGNPRQKTDNQDKNDHHTGI